MVKPLIVGAGSALVDLLIEESDEFIIKMGSEKGGMTLVSLSKIEEALNASSSQPSIVPGGSACNTLVGISALHGKTLMIGRCGKDQMSVTFLEALEKAGVEGRLGYSDTPTGNVLSVVTPDAQRTMFTFLGAAAELAPDDLKPEYFANASVIHLEGYQLLNRPVTETIIRRARESKARLSLDLASFEVVEANLEYLKEIIPANVDILIANEDEAKAFTGKNEDDSLELFARMSEIAVVKRGKKGALAARGAERAEVGIQPVKTVDTTGAGDLWASGFLYGLTHGYTLENAAKLGSCVADEVVQVMGAVIPPEGWNRVKSFKSALEDQQQSG
jgi:sugar/nucleoside kinase (ribokinase family)